MGGSEELRVQGAASHVWSLDGELGLESRPCPGVRTLS